eukprot:TRINITY_DN872_c0_g1_i10.p2 TRINITY_DN872_c0_g1~~TRINITY_DN872_c0_g1_i10.p2  ORF type:complete len:114 (-),score=25.46 TRINITY_DN872_c0_g1_i10:30-371(-)
MRKKSSWTEVTELLRRRGIDLDNNRFLILQGEVEQIALMKAKVTNEYKYGMLEYLEDIIGTNKYLKEIEKLAKQVDETNEERTEKLNRAKSIRKRKIRFRRSENGSKRIFKKR